MLETEPEGETLCNQAARVFAAYQGGDRSSFDDLVRLLTPLVWHTVRAQGVDTAGADDVVQTVWMRLLRSGDAIRDPQTVVKWLLTVARRESWRVVKRARSDPAWTATPLAPGNDDLVALPQQRERGPEEVLVREDGNRRLWSHVENLSERCRALLRVIAFADRPDYAEIADSLAMPVGSIGPTRGRCLAKLRQELAADPRWDGEEQ